MKQEEIRKIQMALLQLAKKVHALCKKHDIPYWITSGNLLGAVRYKGFIPWDDDLDFCLMPDDYHRLISRIREEILPQNPDYLLYNDHRPFVHFGEFLADTNHVWDLVYPVKIDFIRMKSVPNTPAAIQKDWDMVNMLAFLYNKKNTLKVEDSHLIQRVLFEGSWWFRRERFMVEYEHYLDQCNELNKNNLYTLDYNNIYAPRLTEYYQYDDIFPLQTILFEKEYLGAPNNIENFLVHLYGEDYMTPPPENARKPAHFMYRKGWIKKWSKYNIRFITYIKAVKNSITLYFKIKKLKKKIQQST